jgi:dTDP-4-dehydrorhamnose reductase
MASQALTPCKIVLLGSQGQVGWELRRALSCLGEVLPLHTQGPEPWCGDLTQTDRLLHTLEQIQPRIIVNAAAYTAVDRAESEPDQARQINAVAPGLLAGYARQHEAWLVQYSTDYVFDGQGSNPRDEQAGTGPLSVYGRTKLEGEERIRASGCQHLLLRTSWVYAARGQNFAKTMLRLAAERDSLSVINDQVGAPTGADLLADLTAHMLPMAMNKPQLSGTYHAVASGETTWYEYARFVIEWARAHGQPLRLPPEGLHPIPSSQYPTPAQRPLNSRLDNRRLAEQFGLVLPPWQLGVERMLEEIHG